MQHTSLTEKFVLAGGFRTRYLEGGNGATPVVLLHDGGFGGAAETTWGNVAPALVDAGYRVIVPDMLGFGGTDKAHFFDRSPVAFRIKHIADLCAAIGVSGAHFAGNSLGGTLIMRALAVDPLPWPFSSACSITGTGGPWRVADAMAKLSEFDGTVESMARLVALLANPAQEGFDHDSYVRQRHAQSLVPGHYAALAATRLQAPWEEGRQSAQADVYPQSLKGCNVPLLLVETTEDPTCQPAWSAKIQEVVPAAVVEKISGRHSPNLDHPKEISGMLLRWLKQVQGN